MILWTFDYLPGGININPGANDKPACKNFLKSMQGFSRDYNCSSTKA
jgi:hypothetical protein